MDIFIARGARTSQNEQQGLLIYFSSIQVPMINFTCYWCNKAFAAPDNLAGKAVKCKWCGQKVKLPQKAAPPQAPPPVAAAGGGDPFSNLETASAEAGSSRRRS